MIAIRAALPADYPSYAQLFAELLIDDPVPSLELWLKEFAPTTWVAAEGGDVIGYCYVQAYADDGHVQNIVVAPWARNKGVGFALMQTAADHFRALGKAHWRLNVRADNTAALALYGSFGFQRQYSTKLERLPWSAMSALPPSDARVQELSPGRDQHVEQYFELTTGLLARLRDRGRTPLEATSRDGSETLGLAVFDQRLQRARPFRVIDVRAIAPLLETMRVLAPSSEHISLLADNDSRLAEILEGAGAEVRLETLHMRAAL